MSEIVEPTNKPTESESNTQEQASTKQTPIDTSKFISKDDLSSMLDKIRKQERDKMYSQLETQKQQIESLKLALDNKVDVPQPEPEPEPDPDTNPGEALEFFKQQMQSELESMRNDLKREQQKAMDLAKEYKKKYEKDKLDSFREELVKDLRVPQLVQGNSVEELQKSYEEAKAYEQSLLEEIRKEEEAKVRQQLQSRLPGGLNIAPPPGNGVNSTRGLSATERRNRVRNKDFIANFDKRILEIRNKGN